MAQLLTASELPAWFSYPLDFLRLCAQGTVDFDPWIILQGDRLKARYEGVKTRYPGRALLPFARREDNDDIACWERDQGERVIIIHDFASDGYENVTVFDTFADWLREVIDAAGDYQGALFFTDSLPPATENDIARLAALTSVPLPASMIALYQTFNGGQPLPSYVHDEAYIYPINAFFTVDEMCDCFHQFDEEGLPEGFKKGELLPFAYDPGSGIYAVSLRENDPGQVYFYILHEQAEIFGIWPDFAAFLASFTRYTRD
ncbi:SMI1/KNR4 family protein [Kosakonia sp.]|uniref:SMI1/KNR4 family protein n=1 Tax=Kosakonia sp. TaxID=1916651 RepID=UPI0028A0467C|nr:SMI1/KNR4 family protein [Kosakonia sp.]